MPSIVNRTIVVTAICIYLAAPLAWGCDNETCHDQGNQTQEPVPTPSTPAENLKPRSREMNISDFVTGEQNPGGKGISPDQQNAETGSEKKFKRLLEPKGGGGGCDDDNC